MTNKALSIFNQLRPLSVGFDDDTKNSFVELYTKVDSGANAESIMEDQRKAEVASQLKEDNDSESPDDEEDNPYNG